MKFQIGLLLASSLLYLSNGAPFDLSKMIQNFGNMAQGLMNGKGFDMEKATAEFTKLSQGLTSMGSDALKSLANFKPNDFMSMAKTIIEGKDTKVMTEMLDMISKGGEPATVMMKFAETDAGQLMLDKMGPMVENVPQYREVFNNFKKSVETDIKQTGQQGQQG